MKNASSPEIVPLVFGADEAQLVDVLYQIQPDGSLQQLDANG